MNPEMSHLHLDHDWTDAPLEASFIFMCFFFFLLLFILIVLLYFSYIILLDAEAFHGE